MLTQYDTLMMEDDVRSIIGMWGLTVSVLKPLPIADQPNWNKLMHEYGGDICYTLYKNVPFERKDQFHTIVYDMNIDSGAGDSDVGRLTFTTSDLNLFVDDTCRVIYENEQWRVINVKERIGEKIVIVERIVGSTEKWATTPSNTIDLNGVV